MVNDTAPTGGSRAVPGTSPADDPPQPAAGPLSIGIVLVLIGTPLLAVAGYRSWWYDSNLRGMSWPEAVNPGLVLFVVAALLLVVGSACVGWGVFRMVQRADRRAGVRRIPRDPAGLPPIPQ